MITTTVSRLSLHVVHVDTTSRTYGIRSDTGVFEQTPGPADLVTAFEDAIAQVRALLLYTVCKVDARDTRAYNDHIVVVNGLVGSHLAGVLPWDLFAGRTTGAPR